jgi:hypothetical protein
MVVSCLQCVHSMSVDVCCCSAKEHHVDLHKHVDHLHCTAECMICGGQGSKQVDITAGLATCSPDQRMVGLPKNDSPSNKASAIVMKAAVEHC